MPTINTLAVANYSCPLCRAQKGRPCKTTGGYRTPLPHLVRRKRLTPAEVESTKIKPRRPAFLQQPLRMMQPRATPCGSCPYRQDCPSGVWHPSEYAKLTQFDLETAEQPAAVFMCHSERDNLSLCRGWLDTHDKASLLSLRLAATMGLVDESLFELPKSDVPVFASGLEAAYYGLKDIENPSPEATALIAKLEAFIERTKRGAHHDCDRAP